MQPINGNQNENKLPALSFESTSARNAWVVFQLRLKGKTLSSFSRELGLSRVCAAQALHRSYPVMEQKLADELGVTPNLLFPERYQEGVRVGWRGNRHA
jgi:Ner family transcriptional regulator